MNVYLTEHKHVVILKEKAEIFIIGFFVPIFLYKLLTYIYYFPIL